MTTTVSMTVNGRARSTRVESRTLLVQYLRDHLGLTGTHVGVRTPASAAPASSTSTAGVAVKSCTVLAAQAKARRGDDDRGPRRRRRAAPDAGGVSATTTACSAASATPGMVMSAIDIANRHPAPDETTVRRELEGNICRCTGYHNIVKAVIAGAAAMGG